MTRLRHVPTATMAGIVCLGLLCSSTAFGQQSERNRQQSDGNEQQRGAQRAGQMQLPQFLQELDLSSEQETQIKQAMRQHNQKLRQAWRQFHTTHARAVELEAAWASAVRDSLSEEDQRKFDQQRMQDREMSRRSGEDASQQRGDAENRQRDARQRGQQPDAEAPDSAANRQADRQQRRQQREQRQRGQSDSPQASDRSQSAENQQDISFVVITIASPERFTEGTNQTPQQKQQCAKACQEYKQELTSVWQKLHQLHHELVKIEADRIQAVEEQLTEEQLTKLQESRQEPQPEQASTTSTSPQSR